MLNYRKDVISCENYIRNVATDVRYMLYILHVSELTELIVEFHLFNFTTEFVMIFNL